MDRIGIFGGSFNPIHCGHIQAALAFRDALSLNAVHFIPAASPPHKELPTGSPSGSERFSMLRLAVSGIPGFLADDRELRRGGKSYTIDTLRELRAEYPNAELFCLMGTDMFLRFTQWRDPASICMLSTPVVILRATSDRQRFSALEAQAATITRRYSRKPIILQNEILEITSTTVRRMLAFQCAGRYLPDGVERLIQKENFYDVRRDLRALSFDALRAVSLSLLEPNRISHVCGCCEVARALARRYGADETDAARAAVLHDITKALDRENQLLLCKRFQVDTNPFERRHYKLLHAKTGAAIARDVFGENEAVCSAIRWHTSGRADMSLLEKVIYIADYVEDNRSFPGVERLREAAQTNLDVAMLLGLQMTIAALESEGKPLGRASAEAWDFYLAKGNGYETIRQ